MGFNANLSKFTCFFSVYTDKLYGIKQIHETGKSRIASVAAPKTCSIALVSTFEKKWKEDCYSQCLQQTQFLKLGTIQIFPMFAKGKRGCQFYL